MSETNKITQRVVSIDRLRGLIVFNMLFFQCAERFGSLWFIGQFASHRADKVFNLLPNMTIADIGQPLFIFVIAMTYIPSFNRRMASDGRTKAYLHFLFRYLSIIGVGCCIRIIQLTTQGRLISFFTYPLAAVTVLAIISAICLAVFGILKKDGIFRKTKTVLICLLVILGTANLIISTVDIYSTFFLGQYCKNWNVLQSIGGAGLLMLLFVEAPTAVRGVAASLFFGIFTFIHSLPGFMEKIDIDIQGGVIAVLSWGAMLLAFSVMSDLFYRDREAKKAGVKGIKANSYIIGMLVLAVLGAFGATFMVLNKGSVSPGYVLVNLPICSFIFWIFSLFDKWNPKFKFLQWWGYSPIFMYLMLFIFNDTILGLAGIITELPLVPALVYVVVTHGLITWIAFILYSKKKNIKL